MLKGCVSKKRANCHEKWIISNNENFKYWRLQRKFEFVIC